MKRILCVWLQNFPIQRLHRAKPELKSAPCVLYHQSGQRAQVVAVCRKAACSGIQPGMPLAEAQALLESAAFVAFDSDADQRELETLAEFCQQFSPLVSRELAGDSHCLLLDITGCEHLFGDTHGLVCQLAVKLATQHYFTHIAVAGTIGAAWAIARYGHATAGDRRLKSLPVEALRLPRRIVDRLQEFDLRTIRQLTELPRDSLPSRFGSQLLERMDQVSGSVEEQLASFSTTTPASAEWRTEDPICHPEAIRSVSENLLNEVLEQIAADGAGIVRLVLTLKSESNSTATLEMNLTRPTCSASHLLNLLDLKLETQPIPEWVCCIHLEAAMTAVLQRKQGTLFAAGPSADESDLRRLTDRLSARLGQHAVVRPILLPEFVPERAFTDQPVTDSGNTSAPACPEQPLIRPLELFSPPVPVKVTSAQADGAPIRMEWQHRTYRITHATRPERISTDWWHDDGKIDRNYYRIETQSGSRFWIFQTSSRHWFLHGIF